MIRENSSLSSLKIECKLGIDLKLCYWNELNDTITKGNGFLFIFNQKLYFVKYES